MVEWYTWRATDNGGHALESRARIEVTRAYSQCGLGAE